MSKNKQLPVEPEKTQPPQQQVQQAVTTPALEEPKNKRENGDFILDVSREAREWCKQIFSNNNNALIMYQGFLDRIPEADIEARTRYADKISEIEKENKKNMTAILKSFVYATAIVGSAIYLGRSLNGRNTRK